jgi:hypothetical protein
MMTRSNSACAFAQAKRPRTCRGLAVIATWLTVALSASAPVQAEDKEPIAVLELGGASEWGLGAARPSYGPSVAAEFTAIKDWLEIEPGIGPLFNDGHPEWMASVIFRKPFDLSKTIEFEPGVGPEWSSDGKLAGVLSLHFMLWSSPEHKSGWFVEPTYSYSFSNGHQQALGIAVGLLIPIR